jgi:hypothetical protein
MNNLTNLIPILFAALQLVNRELVGAIPASSMNMTANGAAKGQTVRVPLTPESENQDITPGTAPKNGGEDFGYVDVVITKNKIAKPIVWTGDEEIAVGGQLNQMLINQYAQAMRSLCNEVERDLCLEATIGALSDGNVYGTPGTTPFATNLKDLAQIKKIQDDNGTPLGDRHLIINTATGAALRTLEKLTNVNQSGENTLLRQGVLTDLMGYAVRESAGFQIQAPGSVNNVTLSADVNEGVNILPVDAVSGTLNKGALLTIGGRKYMVAADVASGDTVIVIAPKLLNAAVSGSTLSVGGQYLANVAFSRDFLYLAARTPAMPSQGDEAKDVMVITDPVSGLSFQVALYGAYRQTRVEIGLAWGQKAVNIRHGACLLG